MSPGRLPIPPRVPGRAARQRSARAALALVLLASLLGACGGGGGSAGASVRGMGGQTPFYDGRHLGDSLTVRGSVTRVLDPRTFTVSTRQGPHRLLVVSRRPVTVTRGERVRVTGTAGQLHDAMPSEGEPYTQQDLYHPYQTRPYLYHARLQDDPRR